MDLLDDTLELSRERSQLDRDVLSFVDVLETCDVEYVIVSGYVAILTGRSRATEDVDVVLEPLQEEAVDRLTDALQDRDYWGMAMPLEEAYSMLAGGDRIRVAEEGEFYPNFEVWFASNEVERTALSNALTVEFDDEASLQISPIELQIAYKLRLAQRAGSMDGRDFEDALHLHLTFEGDFKDETLETYVSRLEVEDYYAELRRV